MADLNAILDSIKELIDWDYIYRNRDPVYHEVK